MALATPKQVEDFAIEMTGCADSIHERLIRAIKNKEVSQSEAQSLFQDEITLRQHANSLYIEAANCVVEGVADSQKSLLELIDTAGEKITTMRKIARFVDLVADLLVLAAAAYAARPEPILAALVEIKEDLRMS
jgi:hypothetical protein